MDSIILARTWLFYLGPHAFPDLDSAVTPPGDRLSKIDKYS
jgi:hypothetical protein